METIKEEKKADLEQLLNSLIEKGWKPRNIECTGVKSTDYCLEFYTELKTIGWISKDERHLVSRESGLWQFVCENGMVNVDETEVYYFWLKRKGTLDRGHYYLSEAGEDIRTNNFEYRLIESALKDESELEDFLLNSIKLD